METPEILDEMERPEPAIRRRKLLPWWIRVFCWLFMISAALMPVLIATSLLRIPTHLELYGFQSQNALDAPGLFIMLLFMAKGVAGYGLWFEKDWGLSFAMNEALAGIFICTVTMLLNFLWPDFPYGSRFRAELVLLVPYIYRLGQMRKAWTIDKEQ